MKLYSDAALAKILDKGIFHQISDVADRLGVECYVVGGYVRDIFLERPSDDIDVVVVGSGIEVAKELKKALGRKAHLSVFRHFGTAQVKFVRNEEGGTRKEFEVEFVGARKESYSHDSRKPVVENGTLEDDQNRRDFTINAMAICLNKSRFGELVDPFNGIADLQDGIIATPLDPEVTFSDDPLRMMRCIRFATQLNFRIEENTFRALENMADRIRIVSGERIEVELNKIIMAPHPSIGFEYLQRSGILQIILPELAALDIVERRDGRAHKIMSAQNRNKSRQSAEKRRRMRIIRRYRSAVIRLFFGVLMLLALIGLILPLRPKVSAIEKRELEKWPRFSLTSIWDGSYFSQISTWYADTFPFREKRRG